MSAVTAMSRRGALREYLGGALWVLPTIAVVVSLVAGAVLAQFEVDADAGFGRLLFQGDAGAARELLIVVSATMITVTGLVFSLTVVALQISSTQFSPRLLRSFLRDRGTQIVLSIFVSTFAYATAGLYTVGRLEEGQPYVPRIAISGSLLLALGSVAAFVWYLHHLAHSIQIDDVMRRTERATLHVLARSAGGEPTDAADVPVPPADATPVLAPTSGYVQAAFPDAVVGPAAASEAVVRYRCAVGDHVVTGAPIADVWTAAGTIDVAVAERLADAGMRVGFERTFEQDASFGIRQLVDIALRAMSPAINDPYTAVQSIQHISVVLCAALPRRPGPRVWRDDTGEPRVFVPAPTLADLLDLACGQLRRVAAHEPAVVQALLMMLAEVGRRAAGGPERATVNREVELLHADARRAIRQPADLVALVEPSRRATSTPTSA
jgi:uncharacterized membrane protein